MGQTTTTDAKAIFHPWVDGLAIGGLSIGFITFLLVVEPSWNTQHIGEQFIILSALFNWPHFMATYRILYGSRETVERYRWSTTWMPLALAVYCLAALLAAPYTDVPLNLAVLAAGAYLAWHYTGQTWGMMAAFSFLGGAPFEEAEKKFIRLSLRILLCWHVVWFVFHAQTFGVHSLLIPEYFTVYWTTSITLIGAGSILGGYGMWRYIRRIGRTPPLRVVIPFVSIWLWYALLAVFPFAIFWVQISHALQYLLFPARIEINRQSEALEAGASISDRVKQVGIYAVVLVGSGVLLFRGLPYGLHIVLPAAGLEVSFDQAAAAIGAFINIHHYFADGAIWKLSNPTVRGELFSHLNS